MNQSEVSMCSSFLTGHKLSKRVKRVLQIYWGHGIYGIESASKFYFGKHPSLLTLGESAMLAGIVPAPEVRSPFRDPSRGKTFQARVLKRMVNTGFLDNETALSVVKQALPLHADGPGYSDGLLHLLSLYKEDLRGSCELDEGGGGSTLNDIWDWETQSKIWEICEDFERWILKVGHKASTKSLWL